MTKQAAMRPLRSARWEQKLLGLLAYPVNIALGGAAAFLVALPLITILPAAIALARALARWRTDGDDAVFTNTFREFAQTWRRTIALGAGALLIVAVLTVDTLFLMARLSADPNGLALVLAAATVPVAIVTGLFLLAIPTAATLTPDEGAREWLRGAARLIFAGPLRSIICLAISAAFLLTCLLLPTILPFVGLSIPVYLALITWSPAKSDATGDGQPDDVRPRSRWPR